LLEVNAIADTLIFQPETSEAFEQALKSAASYIGFVGQRPEVEWGKGPDVLWSLGNLRYFVIECKNGATVDYISKDYCNQLAGSANWFIDNYDSTCSFTPLMIHPSRICENAASPHQEMRVVAQELLPKFVAAIKEFTTTVVSSRAYDDAATVHEMLTRCKLTPDLIIQAFTAPTKIR
jgi:hypothetical protein